MVQSDDYVINRESVHLNQPLMSFKNIMNDEVSILQSNRLMAETVRLLDLDMSYTIKGGIRVIELYTRTPILLHFPEVKEHQSFTLKAKLLPYNKVQLWDFEMNGRKDNRMVIIQLNETVDTPFGTLIVAPTQWYEEKWIESTITVRKETIEKTINHFYNAVDVSLVHNQSSVISLSIKDVSIPRAEDVLNTLIALYIEESADYREQHADNAEKFIDERIFLLKKGIDFGKAAEQKEDEIDSTRKQEILALQYQYMLGNYIKEYLENPAKKAELLPDVGIDHPDIEQQISSYNQQLLKRNFLTQNKDGDIQIMQEMNKSLQVMRQDISKMIDGLLSNLNTDIQEIKLKDQLEKQAGINAASSEEMNEMIDQQKLKENLFQYLLQKREENAINKAAMDNSIRHVDNAFGSPYPVAPNAWIILSVSILLSVFIPFLLLLILSRTASVSESNDEIKEK